MTFLSSQVEITVDYNKLKAELEKAKDAVTKTANKMEKSFHGMGDATKKVFSKMSGYAKSAMGKIGHSFKAGFDKVVRYAKYALLAIAALAIKSFASLDDAMQKSVAIMGDVTPKIKRDMKELATAISLESVTSATELAKSYFYLASAGLSAKQSLAALPAIESFAVAGAFDMAKATDLVTDAQSALGLTVKDSEQNLKNIKRMTDVLIGANTLANASTEQFSIALMRAGPAMKAYKIELEEGTAVLAAYADQGKKAELGGELFSRMLRLMISGFTKNKEAWDKFGISIVDANDKMRPLADIVKELTTLLEPMGVTQKAVTLEMLGFQARSQQTIMPLLGMGDAIERYNKELEDMEGITQRVKDEQLQSFSAQMKILWNNIVSIAEAIGQGLSPVILDLGKWIRENRDTVEMWALSFTEKLVVGIYKVGEAINKISYYWQIFKTSIVKVKLELLEFAESIYSLPLINASVDLKYLTDLREEIILTRLQINKMTKAAGTIWSEAQEKSTGAEDIKEYFRKLREGPTSNEGEGGDFSKTTEGLEGVKELAEETAKATEDASSPDPKKVESNWEKIKGIFAKTKETLSQWATSATDIGTNLGNSLVSAFDGASDALAEFVVKGKADFAALADAIIMDLARMAMRALMAQAISGIFGLFGGSLIGGATGAAGTQFNPFFTAPAPGLQEGGEVKRTGLAVVHKGETFSGIENGKPKSTQQKQVNLNINVSAIDAAGSYQFLERNKKSIANLIDRELNSNNKLRRNPNKWK